MNILNNKKILIIICGGISAYKTLEVIRKLKKEGSAVKTPYYDLRSTTKACQRVHYIHTLTRY